MESARYFTVEERHEASC